MRNTPFTDNDDDLIAQFLPKHAAEALALCARRFGVEVKVIIGLAPLFFTKEAMGSLAARREALNAMVSAHGQLFDAGDLFGLHGAGIAPMDRFEDVRHAEEISLSAEDIFGQLIAENSGDGEASAIAPGENRFSELNPFTKYLVNQLGSGVIGLEVTPGGTRFLMREGGYA